MSTSSKYKLGEKLGAGGMAEVFRASMSGTQGFTRPVAIKRMSARWSEKDPDGSVLTMEARTMASLQHPNIVAVSDFVRDRKGRLCLVMELVNGIALRELVSTGPVPFSVASYIAIEILRGLAYVHGLKDEHGNPLGLVHHDLSGGNVLLSWDGAVKISDFGLSRAYGPDDSGDSQTCGTPAYMAPEQIHGAPLDGRADLFAVGVLLYELLTGASPWVGPNAMAVMGAILMESPAPPRDARPELPGDLEAIILQLLERDVAKRPPSATAAIGALEQCGSASPRARSELAELLRERFPSKAPATDSEARRVTIRLAAAAAPRPPELPQLGAPGAELAEPEASAGAAELAEPETDADAAELAEPEAGTDAAELAQAGADAAELAQAGADAPELAQAGADATELPEPGAGAAELAQASAGAAELAQASAGAAELAQAGAGAAELAQAGADAAELAQAGADAAELAQAGADAAELAQAGADATELPEPGAGAAELAQAGADAPDLAMLVQAPTPKGNGVLWSWTISQLLIAAMAIAVLAWLAPRLRATENHPAHVAGAEPGLDVSGTVTCDLPLTEYLQSGQSRDAPIAPPHPESPSTPVLASSATLRNKAPRQRAQNAHVNTRDELSAVIPAANGFDPRWDQFKRRSLPPDP